MFKVTSLVQSDGEGRVHQASGLRHLFSRVLLATVRSDSTNCCSLKVAYRSRFTQLHSASRAVESVVKKSRLGLLIQNQEADWNRGSEYVSFSWISSKAKAPRGFM